MEDLVARTWLSFLFLDFDINSRKYCWRYLTNWRRWNNRDKVLSSATSLLEWCFRSCRRRCCLRWCYTWRFAMMIFSATQRYNIVVTLFRIVTTLFQHCNAVFPWKSSLRIVPCNPWNWRNGPLTRTCLGWFLSHFLHSHVISLHSTRFYQVNWIPPYGYITVERPCATTCRF